MKIVVYTQAGKKIGMGHVVRVSHLIDLFKARGHAVDIVTNNAGYKYFQSKGYHSIDVKGEDVVIHNADISIVDHMITDNALLQVIRRTTRKLVVIVGAGHTITPETRWIADLVIYQIFHKNDLHGQVPGEKILSGFEWLILSPKYAAKVDKPAIATDFVMYFGGGTDNRLAKILANELRNKGYSVTHYGEEGMAWSPDMYVGLLYSKAFVGSMGMVAYEAICTRTRPFVFGRSDDHVEVAEELATRNLVTNMGYFRRAESMKIYADEIARVYARKINEYFWRPMDLDGKGAYRVAREILR